jgi:hypothetical protein
MSRLFLILLLALMTLASTAKADTVVIFAKTTDILECLAFEVDEPGEIHIFDLNPWGAVSVATDTGYRGTLYADEYGHIAGYAPGPMWILVRNADIGNPFEDERCADALRYWEENHE